MAESSRDALGTAEALEAIASVEHERWSHWQRYLHQQCEHNPDGSLTIPASLVARWTRQMQTPYGQLTDTEKDSDREQAREYIGALMEHLNERDTGNAIRDA